MRKFAEIHERTLSETFSIDHGYLVSCKPLSGKHSFLSIDTMWKKDDGIYEVREAGQVMSKNTKAHFNLLNIPLSCISSIDELYSFSSIGGHAIVDENLTLEYWPEILKPKKVIKSHYEGYVDYSSLEKKHKERFARGELRMMILDRDNYQCKICGSSPDDNIHIRLEVHHIRPWSEGGISLPDNLITLCKSCHDGAKLINRYILYQKIGLNFPSIPHEIFSYQDKWEDEERASYLYLLSNTVVMRINNNLTKPL